MYIQLIQNSELGMHSRKELFYTILTLRRSG